MSQPQGKFITLEGVEGVGKSTNIALIETVLGEHGISYIKTREPGGTPLAETLREVLLQKRDEHVDNTAELLMVFAARSQHLQQKILPALRAGTWVVSDRFTDATYAYQGGGRQLSTQVIAQLETLVQGDFRPDLTLILDLPVEVGLQRAAQRSEKDRFESEQQEFFERVRAAYLQRARQHPGRYAVIDASVALAEVQQQIREQLARLLWP
jgi:dTMP kinase